MSELRVLDSLAAIAAADWDALRPDDNPFLSHAFLAGLEQHDCLRRAWGWRAHHLALFQDGALRAAMPLYLKANSHGEFVFDHAWAQAWERAGGRYYPKLLGAVPYSPVIGPRLLVGADAGAPARRAALLAGMRGLMQREQLSSSHLLFLEADDLAACDAEGGAWLARGDVQFHWQNRGWPDFEAFRSRRNHCPELLRSVSGRVTCAWTVQTVSLWRS